MQDLHPLGVELIAIPTVRQRPISWQPAGAIVFSADIGFGGFARWLGAGDGEGPSCGAAAGQEN